MESYLVFLLYNGCRRISIKHFNVRDDDFVLDIPQYTFAFYTRNHYQNGVLHNNEHIRTFDATSARGI